MVGWAAMGAGGGLSWSVALGAAVWVAAIFGATHFWRGQLCGALCWDGQDWSVEDARHPAGGPVVLASSPEVLLDVQSHLWLRLVFRQRRPCWMWVQRSSQPERWMDLRRAVYSRAKPGVDHADESAPASSRGA